jgi:hypothetical protein
MEQQIIEYLRTEIAKYQKREKAYMEEIGNLVAENEKLKIKLVSA